MFELRDYQTKNALECFDILKKNNIVYLQHSVRTGKTLTALEIAKLTKLKRVLFLTKKKAVSSIQEDYDKFNYNDKFNLTVTNY